MLRLKLVLPNGSLEEKTVQMFAERGILFERLSGRSFRAKSFHDCISEVLFTRPQFIPSLVADDDYDLGICGQDCVDEWAAVNQKDGESKPLYILRKLGYNRQTNSDSLVVLIGGQTDPLASVKDIEADTMILSEYPALTRKLLPRRRNIRVISSLGSTESLVPWKYHYGVCLTETGETIKANGLRVIEVLAVSCAVLITTGRVLSHPFLGPKAEVLFRQLFGERISMLSC